MGALGLRTARITGNKVTGNLPHVSGKWVVTVIHTEFH